MSNKITLRPAAETDADRLAQLWVTTFPDKFGPVLGAKAEAVVRDWLRLSQRHLQTTTVAEINGLVVGFVVVETPIAPRADDGRWLWHALQLHSGFFGAIWCLTLTVLIDTNYRCSNDEVYIELLGVEPNWRGQGVARRLMDHVRAVAHTHSLRQITLEVVSDNRPAIRLYEKMGFEIRSVHHSRLHRWITGHASYYQMTQVIGSDNI